MFGKKAAKIVTSVNHFDSLISAKTSVAGPIVFEGSLKICGSVTGNIRYGNEKASTTVLVEDGAEVVGNIEADTIIISGKVNGNIEGKSVYLTATAKIQGKSTIRYHVLQIDAGAQAAGTFIQISQIEEVKAAPAAQLNKALAT